MINYDPQQPFAIKHCKHGLMAYSRNDTLIGRSLDSYGEWCEYEIELLGQILRLGDVVIDVGANIGTHTVAFAGLVGPTGHVFSYEPQPRLHRLLAANITLNECDNVSLSRCAIGAEFAHVPMADLPPDHVVFNFGALPLNAPALIPSSDTTIVMPLDGMRAKPSLIKIDVEGMEADVIRGARETIARHSPVLYLENNGDDSAAIAPILDEIGYRAWWSIGPYFNPENHFGNPVNIWPPNLVPSANLIAVPRRSDHTFDLPEFGGAGDSWHKHYGTKVA